DLGPPFVDGDSLLTLLGFVLGANHLAGLGDVLGDHHGLLDRRVFDTARFGATGFLLEEGLRRLSCCTDHDQRGQSSGYTSQHYFSSTHGIETAFGNETSCFSSQV